MRTPLLACFVLLVQLGTLCPPHPCSAAWGVAEAEANGACPAAAAQTQRAHVRQPRVRFVSPVTGDAVATGNVGVTWSIDDVVCVSGDAAAAGGGPVGDCLTRLTVHHGSDGPQHVATVSGTGAVSVTAHLTNPGTYVFRATLVGLDGEPGVVAGCDNTGRGSGGAGHFPCEAVAIVDVVLANTTRFPVERGWGGPQVTTRRKLRQGSEHGVQGGARRPTSVVFVGSMAMDGQKQVWLHQLKLLPRDRFQPRYVVFSPDAHGPLRPLLDEAGLRVDVVPLSIPRAVDESVARDPPGSLLRELETAGYDVSRVEAAYAKALWTKLVRAMSGAEVVVLGNTGDIGDDMVVAGAVAAGVPVIIVDMPNSEARLHPGHTLAVAPSHATGATVEAIMQRLHGEGVRGPNELPGGARAAHGEVAKAWRRPCQGVPPVAVVNPGADVARFSLRHPAATRARRASHDPNQKVVGFVARVSPEKSIGLLLKASVLVHAQFPGVRFEVVGGGRALADMKRLAACVGARVAFRGPVYAELPEVFESFDVFVNPRLDETFGLVNVEAMAMELPVVSFALAGPADFMVHGTNGLVVESTHPQAIAEAITQLLTRPRAAVALGRAGRRLVEEAFTMQAMVDGYAALYTCVTQCPRVDSGSLAGLPQALRPAPDCVAACATTGGGDGTTPEATRTAQPGASADGDGEVRVIGGRRVSVSFSSPLPGAIVFSDTPLQLQAQVSGCELGRECVLMFASSGFGGAGEWNEWHGPVTSAADSVQVARPLSPGTYGAHAVVVAVNDEGQADQDAVLARAATAFDVMEGPGQAFAPPSLGVAPCEWCTPARNPVGDSTVAPTVVVGYVGQVNARSCIGRFIHAAALLSSVDDMRIVFRVVGTGAAVEDAARLAAALGVHVELASLPGLVVAAASPCRLHPGPACVDVMVVPSCESQDAAAVTAALQAGVEVVSTCGAASTATVSASGDATVHAGASATQRAVNARRTDPVSLAAAVMRAATSVATKPES